MANLIVTIIGIALVAVAAISGAYYAGQAFQNAQINATANVIISEAQQILFAERMWSTNNNQTDISGMGASGQSGTGMSALVNDKELTEWPSLGGGMGISKNLTNPGPQPWIGILVGSSASVTTGAFDNGCYSINGYYGIFDRFIFSYNNQNYVAYTWNIGGTSSNCFSSSGNFASSNSDVTQINNPIVKIAKAINASLKQIPTNANTATMPYIGIPAPPAVSSSATTTQIYSTIPNSPWGNNQVYFDSNNTLQSNYCYLNNGNNNPTPGYPSIACTFGPS